MKVSLGNTFMTFNDLLPNIGYTFLRIFILYITNDILHILVNGSHREKFSRIKTRFKICIYFVPEHCLKFL